MKSLSLKLLIILSVVMASCSTKEKKIESKISIDLYQEYISGVTSGAIKRNDPIIIKFATNLITEDQKGTSVPKSVLSFDPKIEGSAKWVNADDIEFVPSAPLKWGTKYSATLNLGDITTVPNNLKKFEFNFQTPQKQFVVTYSGLAISSSDAGNYELKGKVETSDEFENSEIEKVLKATQGSQNLGVTWEHNPKAFEHLYTISGIKRKDSESTLTISYNGKNIDAENSSNKIEIIIPSLNNFKISNAIVVSKPNQVVEVIFSDPISTEKDLRGLIQLDDSNVSQYKIDDNILRIYTSGSLTGFHTLKINGAIESTLAYKLGSEAVYKLNFGGIKPQIGLLGNGIIVPQSEGLYFPFMAVSLDAVDVRITKIFTNNIHTFLQQNDLEDTYQLDRVGRVIHRSKVDLTNKGASDLNQWNSFNLDLSKLIDIEPGAIYNVEIGFRKEYSLFTCETETNETNEFVSIEDEAQFPNQNYSSVFWRYYYNWQKRDDACSYSYYDPDKFLKRNILGSNFGVIAKVDPNNKTYIYITNLLTAESESGVTVELYDYQNQLLQTASTNNDGMVTIAAERDPFLLIARKGEMVGYLKIDNSTSQSTSNFDVAGNKVQKGLKGFIYGERDVWRPGDSVYVSFILEDKLKTLPDGHPLIMEIYNSKGQFVKKVVKQRDAKSIYPFFFKTNTEDPTGNWQINIRAGSVRFYKTVRIETVKPNRLKVDIKFDDEQLSAQHTSKGTIESKWLHGAPAKDMKAKVDVTFSSYTPKFKDYKNFDFSTPFNNYYGEQITIFDQNLDEKGKADLNFNFKPNKNVSGFLKATFTTKVFEKGGDFSINYFSKPFSPYPNYVGLNIEYSYKSWNKLNNDEAHTVEVATVDENGKPVSLNDVQVKLFELDYRWWYSSNHENLASYAGATYRKPVFTTKINTQNGKGSFTLGKDEERWGRHLLLVTSPDGHVCGQIIYFGYPWGRNPQKGGAQVLALITEKDTYKVGEDITVSFPANPEAKALVTFENGSGVVGQEWISDLSEFTHYTFKAKPEMAPNIYVYITLIQPHAQTANDLPIRLYGVIPIMVEDPGTRLEPQVTMPDEIRPLKEFTVEVSEKNKKSMDYTVAIVDEGLLDITNFKTPEPWSAFFAREALGVKSYDMYNYVMGSFGSRLESMFAVGGGDDMNDNSKKKSERFKPIVKVIGPFHLNANSKAKHKITLPQYVGSVRTMVIAADNGRYGQCEATTPVREPLMVLATMPRVLSPEETVDLPVSVFAMKDEVKKVKVSITTNNMLTVLGNTDSTIVFNEVGEKDVFFKVKSNSKIGIAKIKVEVSSGSEKSFHEIEMDIRQPNLPTVVSQFKLLKPNEAMDLSLTAFGMEGTNKAQLEISSMPPLNLGSRLQYLIRYPHGCVEQTTSSVFPQIYLPFLLDLSQDEIEKIRYYVTAGIEKLQRFQHSSGGFSYWQGDSYVSDWASCYVGHFLLEAERAGYLVPGNMKSEWLKYIRKETSTYNARDGYYSNYLQAYRLYLLGLAGESQISSLNRLKSVNSHNNQTKWLLAAAYSLAGMKDVAYKLVDFRNSKPDEACYDYYGSELRDESVILLAQIAMKEVEQASKMAIKVSDALSTEHWYSTQSTAFGLVALANFGKLSGAGNEINYKLALDGKTISGVGHKLIQNVPLDIETQKQIFAKLTNTSSGSLFINLSQEGVKPGVDTDSESKGLQLVVEYFDQNGKKVDPANITQGKDFRAKVTVYNSTSTRQKNIALSQLFPAGWEIINSRLFDTGNTKNSSFDYQDIRDDRIYTYFDLAGYETKTFRVNLNASYCGEYILAPVTCGAMYDNAYFAKVSGMKVKVTKE